MNQRIALNFFSLQIQYLVTNASQNSAYNEIALECCDSVVSSNVVIMEKCQIIFVGGNDSNSQIFQFG